MSEHEFQRQRPKGVTGIAIGRVDPSIERRAYAVYRGPNPQPLPPLDPIESATLQSLMRQSEFQQIFPTYSASPLLALAASSRAYFMIQNLSNAETLYVAFGQQPETAIGVQLIPGASYEPFQVPQNDIWIVGTGTARCTIVYANG